MASGVSVLLGTLLLSAPPLGEDSIDLPLRWKAGDRLQYEIIKTNRTIRDGKVTFKATTRTDLEIEVLRADTDGYLVAWTQGETRFDDPQPPANPMLQRVMNLVQGLRVLLEIDSDANLVGVQNWKELKHTIGKTFSSVCDELKISDMDAATLSKIMVEVASNYGTGEQDDMMRTRERRMFFLVLGGTFSASEPTEYQDHVPNPFGGDPLPSRSTFVLKEVDRRSERATIAWRQTLDPDQARRIMDKSLRDLAARIGRAVPQGDLLEGLSMEDTDTAEFVVDLSSGWLDRLTHKRLIKTGPDTHEGILTIGRKPADPR